MSSDAVSEEKVENDTDVIVLSSPTTGIMPVKATCVGENVDESGGHAIIKDTAVWTVASKSVVYCPGRIVVSPIINYRTRYVGIEYCDESSLPYIPVRGELFIEENTFRFSIPYIVHMAVMDSAKESYNGSEPKDRVRVGLCTNSNCYQIQNTPRGKVVFVLPGDTRVHTVVGEREHVKCVRDVLGRTGRNRAFLHGLVVVKFVKEWFKDEASMHFDFYSFFIKEEVDRIFGPFNWENMDFEEEVNCKGAQGIL